MRQQIFFEDRLKDFANDKREADGSVVRVFLGLGLLLNGANFQGPGQFKGKG